MEPFVLNQLKLRNRIIRTGCNESRSDLNGFSTDELAEHHRELGAGGFALTTVSYFSVSEDGRSFPDQVWVREEARPSLKKLVDVVHKEGCAISAQITHAGYFSKQDITGLKPMSASTHRWNPQSMS